MIVRIVLIQQQIRFHGKVSGLHLLGRSVRTDDRHDGGIWLVIFMLYNCHSTYVYIFQETANGQGVACRPVL